MEVTCFASYIMKTSQCEKNQKHEFCFEEYIKKNGFLLEPLLLY